MKFFKSFWLIVVLMLVMATMAHAGIMDSVKGVIAEDAIKIALSALFGGLGVFFTVVRKWKTAAIEGVDVILAIKKAIHEKSEGGKQITAKEMDVIVKESVEMTSALATIMAQKA